MTGNGTRKVAVSKRAGRVGGVSFLRSPAPVTTQAFGYSPDTAIDHVIAARGKPGAATRPREKGHQLARAGITPGQ